jgi:hypothetical protein
LKAQDIGATHRVVTHPLCDSEGDNLWRLEAVVELESDALPPSLDLEDLDSAIYTIDWLTFINRAFVP